MTAPPVGVVALVVGAAVAGRTAPAPAQPEVVATMKPDSGAGELLILVVGGVFDSRTEAEAANAKLRLGEMQGYYVVPVAQFQGFREQIGRPGDFALVSTFRTEEGARGFAEAMIAAGHPAKILPERVRSLGGVYAGLGQEAAPDGSGIPGEFGEGLPVAGTVEAATGIQGVLRGTDRTWVLSWETPGPCGRRAVLGNGLGRRGFLGVLREAGVIPSA